MSSASREAQVGLEAAPAARFALAWRDTLWRRARSDGSYGFEEFRRDVEDGGQWTPVQYFSGTAYVSSTDALRSAERCVPWLVEVFEQKPELRMRIGLGS